MKLLTAHRLTPASHPVLLDRMREIYNLNISYLATKPLAYIDRAQQLKWWRELDHTKNIVHIYSPIDSPWAICAFSKVTDRGDHCTPIFAIGGAWWGRGFANEIIEHYLSLSAKPFRGEQLTSNAPICHLNEKFGWQIESTADGVDTLYHPARQQEIYDEILRYQSEGAE
jgi:hypothetical protein